MPKNKKLTKNNKKKKDYLHYKLLSMIPIVLFAVLIIIFINYCIKFFSNNFKETFTSSNDDLDYHLNNGKKLAWFYADWCGHCKKMENDWDNAAKKVNKKQTKMIKINCGDSENPEHNIISKRFNIKGYPTILNLSDGKIVSEYTGKRDRKSLIENMENMDVLID